jgi:hypothetical protein
MSGGTGGGPEWATLEARLRVLEGVEAIRSLKARYAELVDARYAGGGPRTDAELQPLAREIAALFTEDGVWDGGGGLGLCRGREAIAERMARPTLRFSRHYFVNPRIEVSAGRARGRWELLAPCTMRDGRPAWMAGVEDDEYTCSEGVWLHSRMTLAVHFFAPHERGWAP